MEGTIKNWGKALVINDGRPATQSDFNDTVVRKALELYLINSFTSLKSSLNMGLSIYSFFIFCSLKLPVCSLWQFGHKALPFLILVGPPADQAFP